jgi:hypothetical protein
VLRYYHLVEVLLRSVLDIIDNDPRYATAVLRAIAGQTRAVLFAGLKWSCKPNMIGDDMVNSWVSSLKYLMQQLVP